MGAVVLALSYLGICLRTGTPWPWQEVVHETGARTLAGTILYFEHAARELPLDIVLGIAIGGTVLSVLAPTREATTGRRSAAGFALASALVMAVILGGTWLEGGVESIRHNVLQYHTRPSFGLEWGSHWRYHLLSRLALILGSIGLAGLLSLLVGESASTRRAGVSTVRLGLLVFVVLTVAFAGSWQGMVKTVADPIYLGHQARELVTHLLTTLPISWGVCLLLAAGVRAGRPLPTSTAFRATPFLIRSLAAGGAGALLGLFLGLGAALNDAPSQGQTEDVAMLVFPHFFEHSFSYLVVPAVAALTYQLAANTELRRED